jgi:arsenite-transporting ATPase
MTTTNTESLPKPADSFIAFVDAPSRFLFFTGKGGVGKTSLACASAIALADRGRRVLLVSTDPASNLDEVLGQKLNGAPTPIPGVPNLLALNIDPEAAAHAYRERLVGPYRGKLPDAIVRGMEEQLSGACTMEIAAFDEFSRLLGQPEATAEFDHVIFDTAPTGHTLRLMTLPTAWTGFLNANTTANSCLGPLAGLQKQRVIYENAVAAMADGQRTTLVLVSRAQKAALAEAERTSGELAAIGVRNQRLVLNGLFKASDSDPVALALESRGAKALTAGATFLSRLPVTEVPLRAHNLLGLPALRALVGDSKFVAQVSKPAVSPTSKSAGRGNANTASIVESVAGLETRDTADLEVCATLESLTDLVDDFAKAGRGVIMTMGKGGVGKTTIAAAIATELARRGHKVHLSTTDPAAHVAAAAGNIEGLTRRWRRAPTLSMCWRLPARISTPTGAPCLKKICVRLAPRKLRCSAPSRAPWRKAKTPSWCSTPRPLGTRCCCSTPLRLTIAKWRARPATCRRKC